jgi:hypothetical protein
MNGFQTPRLAKPHRLRHRTGAVLRAGTGDRMTTTHKAKAA